MVRAHRGKVYGCGPEPAQGMNDTTVAHMCGLEDEDLSCRGDWGSHWCCPLTKHRCYLVSPRHVMCVWLSTHSSQLREHPALWFRCCDLDYPGFPIVYYVFRQMLVSNWEAWGFGLTLSRGAGQLESTFPKGDNCPSCWLAPLSQ